MRLIRNYIFVFVVSLSFINPSVFAKEQKESTKLQNPIISNEAISFIYYNNHANSVYLKSSFDDWKYKYPFVKNFDNGTWNGYWVLKLPIKYELFRLKKGRYTYKLLVDGEFIKDGLNPNSYEDAFGFYLSYFDLKDDIVNYQIFKNPVKVVGEKNIYRFIFKSYGAKRVSLVGSFNHWNSYSLPMINKGNGIWEITLKLNKGKYYYNLIVDDKWIKDPLNTDAINTVLDKTYSYFKVE